MDFYRVLELAVAHDPVRYRDLILNPRPSITHRVAPATRGRPESLERAPADRPRRSANAPSSGWMDSPYVAYQPVPGEGQRTRVRVWADAWMSAAEATDGQTTGGLCRLGHHTLRPDRRADRRWSHRHTAFAFMGLVSKGAVSGVGTKYPWAFSASVTDVDTGASSTNRAGAGR
jgi:hypothetical protein